MNGLVVDTKILISATYDADTYFDQTHDFAQSSHQKKRLFILQLKQECNLKKTNLDKQCTNFKPQDIPR